MDEVYELSASLNILCAAVVVQRQVRTRVHQTSQHTLFFFYKKLFYKKVSLIFTKKLRKSVETFGARMKMPNKKVRKKLHILTLNALFFIIFRSH